MLNIEDKAAKSRSIPDDGIILSFPIMISKTKYANEITEKSNIKM